MKVVHASADVDGISCGDVPDRAELAGFLDMVKLERMDAKTTITP
jgi:hypothetical protein